MLKQGDKAPDFTATTDGGETVKLKDFRGKKVVLYFYPKDNTPGCTREACDLRDAMRKISRRGALVLGISRDSASSHEKFIEKFSLPFALLSDEDGKVCRKYDVLKQKNMYGRTFLGIERSTFIIGLEGRIRRIFRRVKVDGHVAEVLKALEA